MEQGDYPKMKTLHRIAVVITLGVAGTVLAQTSDTAAPRGPGFGGPRGPGGPGGPGAPRGSHGHPIVRVIDTDRDGVLSATELGGASTAILSLDTDADGAVSAAELHAHPARPAGTPQRPAGAPALTRPAPTTADGVARSRPIDPVMLALDANSDGALAALEIANAATSLGALDTNKDGQLTRDEVRPLPAE